MTEPTNVFRYTLVSRETQEIYAELPKDLYPWRNDIIELLGIDQSKWKLKEWNRVRIGGEL